MTTLIVQHTAADYATWKPFYDQHEAVRRQHGCQTSDVFQSADDANNITVVMTFADATGVQGFLGDPSLKEVMAKAGVTSEPQISVLESAESLSYAGAAS